MKRESLVLDYEVPTGVSSVDRDGREKVSSALVSFLSGEIDNLDFHDRINEFHTNDESLRNIRFGLYFLYDDFKSHPISVSREGWDFLRRTVAFLKSDLVRLGPVRSTSDVHERQERNRLRGWIALASIAVAVMLAWSITPWALLLPGLTVGLPVLIEAQFTGDESSEQRHSGAIVLSLRKRATLAFPRPPRGRRGTTRL